MPQPSEFFSSVEEFVKFSDGSHAIKKILIANNGIGAIKAIRSIRRWSFETFGNERLIQFVVMATPEDLRANAEYIRMGDEVVDVPGGSNNNNYANVTLICEIAERHKVDAVMPMWGHASENPNLPDSLLKLKHKVTFIGPPAAPMQALGDKIGSTIIAQSATVPVISWNGDAIRVDYKSEGIPQHVYDQANVATAEDALACAERIGYPVMIKASEGGGGKGIRKVGRSEDVLNAYRQVQGEIPGSPIFVMKMASNARHLEVQLLADQHGNAIALSGRDCSVQRRHQKIIEEGPPIAAPLHVFKEMERAAVALAKTVGYSNAGTVEYLYLEQSQEFAFLELNPRLQVEHPVTENILGLNLPCCQLQVAMGLPLHRIGDIRRLYGRHPRGKDTIDFDYAERMVPPRHCIAVRVTAENPESAFQPTSGKIAELNFRSAIDVWGYFSVDHSGNIHEFADSQFGHIFASGPDRESARRAMIVALKELEIRGDIRTTIEYIIKMLQSSDFIENKINTDWLDGRISRHKALAVEEYVKFEPPVGLVASAGAALQGYQLFEAKFKEFADMLRVGQIPSKNALPQKVAVDLIYNNVKYSTIVVQTGASSVLLECNGEKQTISIRSLSDGGYLLNICGKSHLVYSRNESGGARRMILDGHTCIFTPEYDPTRLFSTVAGKLARLLVSDGSHVNPGDPYVEIEVMKMYMPLKALEAGTIHFQMSEGATLSPGDVIALVKLDNPDKVVKAEIFTGVLTAFESNEGQSSALMSSQNKPHVALRKARETFERVLNGYSVSDSEIDASLSVFIASFRDKALPALETEEALSVLRGRIDAEVYSTILNANTSYLAVVQEAFEKDTVPHVEFPSQTILGALHKHALVLTATQRNAFNAQTQTLWSIAEQQLFSTEVRILASLLKFLDSYLAVERHFDKLSFTDVVSDLRKDFSGNLEALVGICRSHLNIGKKNYLMIKIVEEMKRYSLSTIMQQRPNFKTAAGVPLRSDINVRNLKVKLTEIAKIRQPVCSHLSLTANIVLMEQSTISSESRRQRLNDAIIAALTSGGEIGAGDRVMHMKKFIESNISMRDLLLDALRQDADYQVAAIEIYIRKTYQKTHGLKTFTSGSYLSDDFTDDSSWVRFEFATKMTKVQSIRPSSRSLSYTDLTAIPGTESATPFSGKSDDQKPYAHPVVLGNRTGIFAKVDSTLDLPRLFPLIIKKLPEDNNDENTGANAAHVIILESARPEASDDEESAKLLTYLSSVSSMLDKHNVSRVTFFMGKRNKRGDEETLIFTFRKTSSFQEDRLFRHIEAPNAYHLELSRLSNFNISLEEGVQTAHGNIHLYKASPKSGKGNPRYFARVVSFTADIHNSDVESVFIEAMDNLDIAIRRNNSSNQKFFASGNHIYVSIIIPEVVMELEHFDFEVRRICDKYWDKMVRLAISAVELKISCKLIPEGEAISYRFVATNPTGFVLKVDQYTEASEDGTSVVFKSIGDSKGPWDGLDISTPYEVSEKFEKQRAEAMASSDTLYVYDWPVLFTGAAEMQWKEYLKDASKSGSTLPENIITCTELVIHDSVTNLPLPSSCTSRDIEQGVLVPTARAPGANDCGMVAWVVTMKTPECPSGRDFVVICNDITHQAGSFGTKEDAVFFKASEYARRRGIPRLFLAANSGARIGMAQSLKNMFEVCWQDENDPSKGFKYIYISKDNYVAFSKKFGGDESKYPVICSKLEVPNGEVRYVVTDIIGEESDLGVENLMGSGLIAGETSRAYDDIFTLTLVVGRTVGIGAYLVRLGQRTIQKTRNSPIILTGYQALNKLMGREIYTTNDQLGGPMIMFPNGVSHLLADTHMESVVKAFKWLSFVPASKSSPLPVLSGVDTIDRLVEFDPPKGLTYDPRLLLCGISSSGYDDDIHWQSGFFDRNSFVEMLSGWAKTVVIGRARLGGIPMGVIVTENRTAEALKPADPADMTSQEKMVQQAGGVWFPDSAYKTAQALKDFNREGLPCIVFANWRGFSGGQRDMFDEVLKFGSMIVDALVAYNQPLFVYIPPFAELRGGAWVVVDSTINSDVMEFYAAENARGGVLEATGAASIKFRDRDIIATAHRLDYVLIEMDRDLAALNASLVSASSAEAEEATVESLKTRIAALTKKIKTREKLLFGVYQQVAVHFADLHDTPGRMKAKAVIKKQVQWQKSRSFFYWRLRRRLLEFDLCNRLSAPEQPVSGSRKEFLATLQSWFFNLDSEMSAANRQEVWEDDRAMVEWLEAAANASAVAAFIDGLRWQRVGASLVAQFNSVASGVPSDASSTTAALKSLVSSLTKEQRAALAEVLNETE